MRAVIIFASLQFIMSYKRFIFRATYIIHISTLAKGCTGTGLEFYLLLFNYRLIKSINPWLTLVITNVVRVYVLYIERVGTGWVS